MTKYKKHVSLKLNVKTLQEPKADFARIGSQKKWICFSVIIKDKIIEI